MDRFRRLIENGYDGITSANARQIIRDSAEVTQYINEKREHLHYVQQLMNDKIIDEAMERVKSSGDFGHNESEGFYYKKHDSGKQMLNERQFTQSNYQHNNMNEMELMRDEIARLRRENNDLKRRLR